MMLGSLLKRLLEKRATNQPGTSWLAEMAALHSAGRFSDAAAVCRAQLGREPANVHALEGLAAALLAEGRHTEGIARLREAADLAPERPDLHANLASVCAGIGDFAAAVQSYRRALALEPAAEGPRLRLIALLKALERYDEAENCSREAPALDGSAALKHALAGVLFEQGRVEESALHLRRAVALAPRDPAIHSDLLRALNYLDTQAPGAVFHEHLAWSARHAAPLERAAPPHLHRRGTERRLRVGYVSPYFRKHAVTFFLESVIEHHDRDAFELLLYADVPRPDDYSERLIAHGARWRDSVGLTDAELAATVRADEVDILVDLSGHTPGNRLLAFARGAAPVQVTWNGYPNTTGMASMHYRITDALCDPVGLTEHFHTEDLVRLDDVFMSWRPPDDAPDVGSLPALTAGPVTFGSFNSCFKITPATVALWSSVLKVVPDSRLVVLTVNGTRAAQRLRDAFGAEGIDPARVELLPRLSHDDFLTAHKRVDIALDAYPFHGTTTTCFSLWMGVPVVCLTGPTHASRVGLSLLSAIGLAELAAATPDAYVASCARLAANPQGLARLRAGLREKMRSSPLTDGAACAKSLERAYRAMWRAWCEAAP